VVADHPVVIIVPTKPRVQCLDQLTNSSNRLALILVRAVPNRKLSASLAVRCRVAEGEGSTGSKRPSLEGFGGSVFARSISLPFLAKSGIFLQSPGTYLGARPASGDLPSHRALQASDKECQKYGKGRQSRNGRLETGSPDLSVSRLSGLAPRAPPEPRPF
jgi:hypothetical protein